MKVLTYPCGPIQANTYILYAEGQPNCLVIDPADTKKITKPKHQTQQTSTHSGYRSYLHPHIADPRAF